MKTKEEILDNKFKERGIRKGWIDESKQAVLDAMDEYAVEYAENPKYDYEGKIDGDTGNKA